MRLARLTVLAAVAAMSTTIADAQKARPKPDIADVAVGVYAGDVISDDRGGSQSDVTITVTKVAPGTVQVASSYSRMPSFTTKLTRAMSTIQQVGGDATKVFLLDLAKTPHHLDVTVDGASWTGDRQ